MNTNEDTPRSKGSLAGMEMAYPLHASNHADVWAQGMTKRELIAMHLMTGIVSRKDSPAPDWQKCGEDATKAADALLEALNV